MSNKPLSINLDDQGVKDFLGVGRVSDPATRKKELVQVAGDVPSPDGTMEGGLATTWHLNRSAVGHPFVIYRQSILVVDVYEIEGEPLKVVLICPKCHHALNVAGNHKRIEFERVMGAPNPSRKDEERLAAQMTTPTMLPKKGDVQAFGKLSIGAFECTWENTARRAGFGVNLCRWKVEIEDNIARDV